MTIAHDAFAYEFEHNPLYQVNTAHIHYTLLVVALAAPTYAPRVFISLAALTGLCAGAVFHSPAEIQRGRELLRALGETRVWITQQCALFERGDVACETGEAMACAALLSDGAPRFRDTAHTRVALLTAS